MFCDFFSFGRDFVVGVSVDFFCFDEFEGDEGGAFFVSPFDAGEATEDVGGV